MPENEGEAASDQSPTGAGEGDAPDELTILRKRQAGADKARDVAIAERDRLAAELEALRARPVGKPSDPDAFDAEAFKRELQADFDSKLAEGTKAAQAKVLDAQFPEARKRYPEVTDSAKLAELESFFSDAPTPIGNNAAKDSQSKRIEDMSTKELVNEVNRQAAGLLAK